jgi:hypothetical protein
MNWVRRWIASIAWLIVASGISITLIVVVIQSPTRGSMFFDVLKLIISWPFVAGALSLTFGIAFRYEISQFIQNIGLIRFPGGEIRTTQASTPKDELAAPPAITLTEDDQKIIREHIESLTKKAADAEQEKEQILNYLIDTLTQKNQELADKHKQVIYWWFQYLSLFLVPITQTVLQWFSSLQIAPTKEYYNEAWKAVVTDANQREIMLMVLLHHGLLEANGPVLQVSQAGKDFLAFLRGEGPIAS